MAVILGSSWRREPAVSRVREEGLSRQFPLGVEGKELRFPHEDLSADLETRGWRRVPIGPKAQRDGPDRPQVLRDIFTDVAVTPRGAEGEDAVDVDELDGNAVYLYLNDVFDVTRPEELHDAPVEVPDLLLIHGILQAQHGDGVRERSESIKGSRPHPLRR